MLAERVGAPASMPELLRHLTERWDGKGPLRRAKGDEIPLPMRIVHVAADAAFQRLLGGEDHAAHLMHERAGKAFDPEIAACCAEHAQELLALDEDGSIWDDVLASEPFPQLALDGESLDRARGAMGSFADLVSPYLSGHSIGVGELAGTLLSTAESMPELPSQSGRQDFSTTSAALRFTHASGRSRACSAPTSGSRCGCTPTTLNVFSPGRRSSRRCVRSPVLTTSGSTDRAITAARMGPRSGCPPDYWQPPTPITR